LKDTEQIDYEIEISEVAISESIQEEVDEATSSHRVESDLNYSDDFTSSSSSSSQSSEKNAVIKTTVLAKRHIQLVRKPEEDDFKTDSTPKEDREKFVEKNEDKAKEDLSKPSPDVVGFVRESEIKENENFSPLEKVASKYPSVSDQIARDDVSKKEALVDQICGSILQDLLSDATRLWSKARKSLPEKSEPENKAEKVSTIPKMTIEVSGSQPPIPRIEKEAERFGAGVLSPRSGRGSIQDLMLTTFDLGSDTSEGNIEISKMHIHMYGVMIAYRNLYNLIHNT
jgi:hypothetical protein